MIHRFNIPCIPRRFDNDMLPYNLNWQTWLIYNLYCISSKITVCSGVIDIFLVFHAGDPGSIPVEGNIFSSSILFFPYFLYIFCNKSLVAFYIKFNALAKSSHQPHFLFFFFFFIYIYINFQIQTALWLQICGYVIF